MFLTYGKRAIMLGSLGLCLSACKPADPPPDLLKTQRQALEQAKALEGQMQKQLEDRMNAAEQEKK